ncbi:polysaccharide transporter, PST family [Micromonospora viridifaciens]|uniref:Polysaccharide transporter, PST family n=1 Tax=Micromonospora viridifaciens TaxID=1881 RepID=A0A1C4YZ90_MICVI|nr:oligosaccharide flippase family protein [Micromonospora viridifaciens]SCF25651.1 polysaccharide transporter, PST family [Micromonospora viridifaciens]
MTVTSQPERSLGSAAGRALSWSFASTVLGKLSTIGIGVALARLLGPQEFGAFAVAMVALLAMLSFNELGVSLAIVRWPGDPREIAPTVTTIAVTSSLLIYGACYLAAPAFAAAMGAPHAAGVVRLLALSVIISAMVAAPAGMLQRGFRQGRKMIADQVTTWVSALTSILCAVAGLGATSLAIGHLAGATAGAVLLLCFEPAALRPGFDRARARALLRFGFPLAGSSIVVFAATNVDRLIVGALLGPVPLGLYVLAFNLASWPATVFSLPVRAVAPALLSRLQHDRPAMRQTFLSAARLLAAVTLPACALLAAASAPLVRFVYGPAWAPAAGVLVWLALLGALRILFELAYDFFVVLANTRVVFAVQLVWLVALLPALWAGVTLAGVVGAGAAQFAVGLLVVLPAYLIELRRNGIGPAALGSGMWLPLLGAAGVAVGAMLIARAVPGDLLVLAASGLASLAVTGLLAYRLKAVVRTLSDLRTSG